jgi:ubiquinone biosynthesis protein UbiJ
MKEITSVNTYSEFAKFFLDHIDHLEKRIATLEAKIAQLEDKT